MKRDESNVIAVTVQLECRAAKGGTGFWGWNAGLETMFVWPTPQPASVARSEALAEWLRMWPTGRRVQRGRALKTRVRVAITGSPQTAHGGIQLDRHLGPENCSIPVVAMARGVVGFTAVTP